MIVKGFFKISVTYEQVKQIVSDKLIDKTELRSYRELSEVLFGKGNIYNESEVRKRMYGMKRLIEIIENESKPHTVIISISDLHYPFNLPIETFKDYRNKIDILQLNGDLVDSQSLSKFEKKYKISPIEELIGCRRYLIKLIKYLNPKKVVVNNGNHEVRFGKYLAKNLDNELIELMPDSVLDLIFYDGFKHYDKNNGFKTFYEPLTKIFEDNIEIEYVDDWKVKIGKTWFIHPTAYRSATCGTVEKAMNYFFVSDKEKFDCICSAHTHAVGDTRKGYIRLIEQGCCADTEQLKYGSGKLINPHQNGFAIICQDENGNLIDSKTKIEIIN